MNKRENVVEMFSTFLNVNSERDSLGPAWETESRLKKSMLGMLEAQPDGIPDGILEEEFWAQYWVTAVLQSHQDSLARGHVSAYLEEVCYWATIKIFQQLPSINLCRVECFSVAREAAANSPRMFKKYNQLRSSVKTYAQFAIKSAILEEIRGGDELQKYSAPALLKAVSKKKLKEALEKAAIGEAEVSKCLLAYQCFRQIYAPKQAENSRQLLPPNAEEIAAIAELYNSLRERAKIKEPVNSQSIQKLLDTCVEALKNSKPIFQPLPDYGKDSQFSSLERPRERQQKKEQNSLTKLWQQIDEFLSHQFSLLPADAQRMLQMEHMGIVSQTDIAGAFGIPRQEQVSRQLKQHRRTLLQALVQWMAENQQICLTSHQLNDCLAPIKEWLNRYCQQPLQEILAVTLLSECTESISLLRQVYGEELKPAEVAQNLQLSESEVKDRLLAVSKHLQAKLRHQVETTLSIELGFSTKVDKKIAAVVEEWLKNAPYATF